MDHFNNNNKRKSSDHHQLQYDVPVLLHVDGCARPPEGLESHKNYRGDTPLHQAAIWGYQDVLEHLIKAGNDVNVKNKNGNTPLHHAVRYQHVKIVDALIRHGADVDARGFNDGTPLHWASFVGNAEIVQLLLERGANPRVLMSDGKLPVDLARQNEHFDVVSLLTACDSRYYSVMFATREDL